jgi:DNA-binding Lrp family transcriptional regulator
MSSSCDAMVCEATIRHIRAVLDPAALGRSLEAQIEFKLRSDTSALDFEAALRRMPQVVGATLMTGSIDCALRVACEGGEGGVLDT